MPALALRSLVQVASLVLLGACCTGPAAAPPATPAAVEPTPPTPTEHAVTPVDALSGDPTVAPDDARMIDCSARPDRVCCMAETPSCDACREQGKAELERWTAACTLPDPATLDCSKPPAVGSCCRALLPKCTACVDHNRALQEQWAAKCKP